MKTEDLLEKIKLEEDNGEKVTRIYLGYGDLKELFEDENSSNYITEKEDTYYFKNIPIKRVTEFKNFFTLILRINT